MQTGGPSRYNLLFAALGLCAVAGLIYGPLAWRERQEVARAKREHDWTQAAFAALQHVHPPPAERLQSAENAQWLGSDYLVFSNGWAAYKLHSWHANDGMGDIALMKTSDGPVYFSDFHFCGGITTDMELQPNGEIKTRPRDAKDFLKHYANRQSWRNFSVE